MIVRLAGIALVALWPALALAQSGVITGTVRAAAGQPLAGVEVFVCGATSGCSVNLTNAAGVYGRSVPVGTYSAYTRNSLGYTNEVYDNLLCHGECVWYTEREGGQAIVVTANALVTANFDLDPGGAIAGTVTDAVSGTPLPNVTVTINGVTTSGSFQAASVVTDASGAYRAGGLPAGRYYAATRNDSGHVDEFFDNVPCPSASCFESDWQWVATPIDVTLGNTSGSRNFSLDRGGHITGLITEAGTGTPLANACVLVVSAATGRYVREACTDASGAYDVGGLAAGTYHALAAPAALSDPHIWEVYDNLPCQLYDCFPLLATATPIAVTVGAITAGKNFALDVGGTIRGVVRSAATAQPLPSVQVLAVSRTAAGTFTGIGVAEPNAAGEYVIGGLMPRTYYVFTDGPRYRHEIYNDIPCADVRCMPQDLNTKGTPIVVSGPVVVSGIDFALRSDDPPGPPQNLRATVDGYVVRLSWSNPYTGQPPTSYVIEAGLAPGTTIGSVATTATSFVVPGVAPGRYYLRVRAVSPYGSGPPSEERLVVVAPNGSGLPEAPENVSGWMSGPRLTLLWAAPASGGTPTGYLVEAGSATGVTNIGSGTVGTRSLTVAPVPAGYYFVRVRAVNAAGIGPPSQELLINAGYVPAPPGAPWGLTSTVVGSTVTLTWSAPDGPAPTSYLLRVGSAPGLSNLGQADTGSTATTAVFPGVPPGTYYLRVHAVNGLGAGVASNEVTLVVP